MGYELKLTWLIGLIWGTATPTDLTALLDRWDTLVADAAHRVDTTPMPSMGGFYTGVMFGMETARDELTTVLAMVVQTTNHP